MNTQHTTEVANRLQALLSELEYARQTHVEWRDCDQSYRDANPHIGDSAFHQNCVSIYDERIDAIKEAVKVLQGEG